MKEFTTVALIFAVIGIVLVMPFLAIWSVNVLFHTGIPYTLTTWAAAAVLTSVLSPSVKVNKNS